MANKLTDEQIQAACVIALNNSLGAPGSDVAIARERNLQYYNAEAEGDLAPPEIEDRSDFVATDVPDTVDGMLPQIMRMFVGSDDAVVFEGQGQPGADLEAKLATAYVNHVFYVRNDGVGILHDWFKDALLQKVGFVKVWAQKDSEDARQQYEGQTQEQLVMLMQDGWMPEGDPEVDDAGLLNFTVVKEDKRICIKIQAVAPSEMRVDVNARWGGEPNMIAQRFTRPRFELQQEGYDVADAVSAPGEVPDEQKIYELGETDDYNYAVPEGSHDPIDFAEVYIKLDRDGDGIAEWLKVVLIDEKVAMLNGEPDIEKVDDHPFCWICPIPRAHAFFGDCPADRAIRPQQLRTRTIRAIEDNMLLTVNQRTYVNTSADVNIDDVLDSRAGGVIRGSKPASEAIQPIGQPNLGAPAYQFNEFVASWAENRTGFNRYSAGTDQNALNKTKGGVELLTSKADARMELIARFFAVGVKQMFAKVLKLAIQHQNVPEMVAINGSFVPINPGEFRNQFHTKINVGLGNGTKEQQMARIMAIGQIMGSLGIPAGVVRPQHIAELIRLAVEAQEFKNPEKFVDPQPTGMPPNPQAFQQMQAHVQQQMQQMQQLVQQLQQENARLKADQASKQGDLALKSMDLQIKQQEFQQKSAESAANLQLKSRQIDQAERSAHLSDAQKLQQINQAGNEDERIAALEQQVQALIQLLMPQQEATA